MFKETKFGVYPRKLKSGKTIYYYWANLGKGKRVYRSTGESTYEKAILHCRNLLKIGKLAVEKSCIFAKYTEHFFVWDECLYIKSRLLHGKSYTRGWAKKQLNLLITRIIPEFGDLDIREIYEKRIDGWLLRLKEEGVGFKTLNHLITILRIIFSYAVKAHDIEESPMANIELFSVKIPEKGILSREELVRLFPEDYGTVWQSKMHYTLNLTAVFTGMRLGEILALKYEMVNQNYITVAYSWSESDGLKCPKNERIRIVPIPEYLYMLLRSLNNDGKPSDYIFSNRGDKPLDHKSVYKHYYQGLDKIGITREVRASRRLSFHSYRHLLNTLLLESGIPPETVRLITGHNAQMTAHYSHIQLKNIKNFSLLDFFNSQLLPERTVQNQYL